MVDEVIEQTSVAESEELGFVDDEATKAYIGQTGGEPQDDFRVQWFGTKANTRTMWTGCRYAIVRWRLQGKALIVYGEGQEMMPPKPEGMGTGASGVDPWKSLRYWKAYFPAKFCAIVNDRMVTRMRYRDYVSDEMMLQVKFPMWLKDIKAYPCRKAVVYGEEKDKNEE